MSDFQAQMNQVVQGFVGQITELARAAARDMIDQALGKSVGTVNLAAGRGRGAKRNQEELAKLSEVFVAFVTKHPGLRIEQINKQLGTTTKDLALPIRKLTADGVVKMKGTKRSTIYYTGEVPASTNGAAKGKKKAKKK